MRQFEIKPSIFWVGATDWAVRDFHGYVTPRGTSYNNYLIVDDQPTLVDAVKSDFGRTTIDNIRNVIDPGKIKNIVLNHIEPDHASAMDKIMALIPDATIYLTQKGKAGLERYLDTEGWKFKVVKTGDTLNIGKYTLTFIETPMLHWPDSMMTYIKEAKLLISQDAFGQHTATSEIFDDEYVKSEAMSDLEDATVDYYANILMPFGSMIKRKVDEMQKLGFDIDMIAPDHGVIWRTYPDKAISQYLDMANGKSNLSVTIIYDTMWYSTSMMSQPITEGIREEGLDCKVIKLRATPMSVAIKEFWKSRGTIIGSPTLNNLMYPSVAEFLTHLRGLRPTNRLVGAFGSYGWGGGAVKAAYEDFDKMKLESFAPGLEVNYRPDRDDEAKCFEFGRAFAIKVKEYHEKF